MTVLSRTDPAALCACPLLYRPEDPAYAEGIRRFQGCPTLAVTHGGRLYVGWYSGGSREPHIENYNLLIFSDDKGATWSEPLLVIPSDRERLIHALDIQLWCDGDGRLHVFWVQNNVKPEPEVMPTAKPGQPLVAVEGYLFDDFRHAMWETVCEAPDAADPQFGTPRMLGDGFLRCKPLVLTSGRILYFNYDQIDPRYAYSISDDGGKTLLRRYAGKKLATPFDEGMAYERRDGSIRALFRSAKGELAEAFSEDGGETFGEARLSGIDCPSTRFYISRTPTGRLLLIHNDDRAARRNMTLSLSEDDGASWPYRVTFDTRENLSYPDADFYDGRIYLTYDRERTGAKEILFLSFTEEDIVKGTIPTPRIISKPTGGEGNPEYEPDGYTPKRRP